MDEQVLEKISPREQNLQNLAEAIEEANILFTYIIKSGKEVEKEVITTLSYINHIQLIEEIDSVLEGEFWYAYSRLTHAALPATAESILLNSETSTRDSQEIIKKREIKNTIITRYSRWAAVVIFVVLFFQIYWVVTSAITTKFQETIELKIKTEEKLTVLQLQFDRLLQEQQAIEEMNGTSVMKEMMTAQIEGFTQKFKKFGDESKHIYQTYEEYLSIIQILRLSINFFSTDYSDVTRVTETLIIHYQTMINTIVVSYLLPFLLGLLGAIVYILRLISNEIKNKTFLPENSQGYQLRIYLGTIAGITFSWLFGFLLPVGENSQFGNASPLAVAFLVGYSVEILFYGLDKLTGNFKS